MKKLLFMVLILVAFASKAQFGIGMTLGPQIPLNDKFLTNYKTGFGFLISPRYYWKNISVGGSIGYYGFGPKNKNSTYTYRASMVPLLLTAETSFLEGRFKPLFGVDAGLNFLTVTERYNDFGYAYDNKTSRAALMVNIYAGANIEVNEKFLIQLNGKFNYGFASNSYYLFMGLNAGVFYRFGKL